jgi:hypothetical protein
VIVRGANWLALKSQGGDQSWNNQRGDKNKLKPAPKHPSSLREGINTRRREKVTLPLPKIYPQQLHASLLFLLPNGK